MAKWSELFFLLCWTLLEGGPDTSAALLSLQFTVCFVGPADEGLAAAAAAVVVVVLSVD